MKKSELKNIIKDCVREVILEEGMLSGIVTEVVQGLSGLSQLNESFSNTTTSTTQQQRDAVRQKMRESITPHSYEEAKKKFKNPELFEGTRPAPAQGQAGSGPLAGVDPRDPGVDISNIPGMGKWGALATATPKN